MIPEKYAILGALVASFGGFYYLFETIRGTAKPNRITWLLWAVFPMITFLAQQSKGVGVISWVSFVSGLTPILVLIASFFSREAYWKTEPIDYVCMLAAIFGISLWAITDNANLAILFSIIADLCAAAPTLIKCFKHPESESWIAYGLSTIGFTFSILTIQKWTFENFAFIVYLALINGAMAVLSARKTNPNPLHFEP